MKLIAHRGNINGPDPINENNPDYIENAISKGYDVEIDIRYETKTDSFFLGHDDPQYIVNILWLCKFRENLWIHCKNIDALYTFSANTNGYNYFWHEEDSYALTNAGYIWAFPGKSYNSRSIIVMPEKTSINLSDIRAYNCFGVCSDYVGKIK